MQIGFEQRSLALTANRSLNQHCNIVWFVYVFKFGKMWIFGCRRSNGSKTTSWSDGERTALHQANGRLASAAISLISFEHKSADWRTHRKLGNLENHKQFQTQIKRYRHTKLTAELARLLLFASCDRPELALSTHTRLRAK